jgi:hypothetical protein
LTFGPPTTPEPFLMFSDAAYIALTVVLFTLTWGFARLCERV